MGGIEEGRMGRPEVDGLSLLNSREDLEYFFLLSPLSHLSVSQPNTDVCKKQLILETIVLGWPPGWL